MSVFPMFSAPTVHVTVPLSCAIIVFVYFNWHGIRHHNPLGYLLSLTGGLSWWLIPLILPVEIISICARMLSLTVRLWANIFASDLIYGIFLALFVALTTWSWEKSGMLWEFYLGFCLSGDSRSFHRAGTFLLRSFRAYIFTILPSVYLGLATSDEH